jgi:hypothetical protein
MYVSRSANISAVENSTENLIIYLALLTSTPFYRIPLQSYLLTDDASTLIFNAISHD